MRPHSAASVVSEPSWARGIIAKTVGVIVLLIAVCFAPAMRAAEAIPPKPENHFNDYTGSVKASTVTQIDRELTEFERTTSNQLLVAVFAHMQSDSSIEDYTTRVFQAWGTGRKGTNNGAVLFVFLQDRRFRIQTGYGLEGTLPDALCKQILENEIAPRFRAGDIDGGLAAGSRAMMAAARGEYRGTGRTTKEEGNAEGSGLPWWAVFIFIFIAFLIHRFARRGAVYSSRGPGSIWIGGGGSSGGWGGGSSGGGGGGSYSGGGGSTGGGGASGSW